MSGWMSNRGRQNVCSFLTKDMGLDWRMGAEWFESQLIDYDPCSNWYTSATEHIKGTGATGRTELASDATLAMTDISA